MASKKTVQTESEMLNLNGQQSQASAAGPPDKLKTQISDNPSGVISSGLELQEFKNVTNQVMQDALHVWAQLWGELESRVPSEGRELSRVAYDASSREWSDFIEKMWLLRHYLDFTKRLSQQEQ
jgi:hypothetical protein